MKVIVGKNCGFCFGVKRAIKCAEQLPGKGNYILGEIIHNERVNNSLKEKGLITIDSLDDDRLSKGDTLLIRTHGEPKSTFNKASEMELNVVDCTCPFVKDIQEKVSKYHSLGYTIAILGNENHPEIIGINGWCDNSAIIVSSFEDLSKIKAEKLCIVVQTTFSEKKFDEIIKKFDTSNIKTVDIFKTICYTTIERQKEAEIISKNCDAVIVLGGSNSNNTEKLFEICKKNCKNIFRVVDPLDFNYDLIKNFYKVGIVFGASTPYSQFQEVVQGMEKVTEEIITTETVVSEDLAKKDTVSEAVAKEEKKSFKSEMEAAFNNIKPSKDYRIGQIVSARISSANEAGLIHSAALL
ncbi:MAG: 4-hydroxy-3-methylbut-2-enyl diphosphate reductase [Clostridia bacterium]|nr:4-hydroxy-3-methylbut-2-enyl diphosphate reductase [Clostridia bacterium]